ncbi:MAG: efflux RND transporter periplasmic adaptor subunit [Planctomycetales bacterium]
MPIRLDRDAGRSIARPSRRGAVTWPILILLSMAAGGVAAWGSSQFETFFGLGQHEVTAATETVRREPMPICLTERGELESANNTTLRHRVERGGTLTLLKLAPEGVWVDQGEVVAELDSSRLQREAKYYQIWMFYYEAALKTAEARQAIQLMSNESQVALAEHRHRMAKLDLEKYVQADYRLKRHKIEGELRLAQENVSVVEERLAFGEKLLRKGYARVDEVKADEFSVGKARMMLARAREKLHILVDFTHKRDLAEKQSRATRYEAELERARLRAERSLVQRQLDVLYGKRWSAYFRNLYNDSQRRIDACVIRAPHAGVVVYANTNAGPAGPVVYEGARVWEGQPLIHLPDPRNMQVFARIHESKIMAVREGQPALVKLDALSGETYHGVVEKVAPVPLSTNWPNINLKEYATVIRITDDPEAIASLKPGMTAQVMIQADPLPAVPQVSVQACVERGGKHFAWLLKENGSFERRQVEVGAANDSVVEIVHGLAEGDIVASHPRTDLSEELDRLHEEVAVVPEPAHPVPGIPMQSLEFDPTLFPWEQELAPPTVDVPPPKLTIAPPVPSNSSQ